MSLCMPYLYPMLMYPMLILNLLMSDLSVCYVLYLKVNALSDDVNGETGKRAKA